MPELLLPALIIVLLIVTVILLIKVSRLSGQSLEPRLASLERMLERNERTLREELARLSAHDDQHASDLALPADGCNDRCLERYIRHAACVVGLGRGTVQTRDEAGLEDLSGQLPADQ